MEINHIRNYYHLQNTASNSVYVKKSSEVKSEGLETYGKDKVAISSDASFKATLSSYAKVYASHKKQDVSMEQIEKLKAAYAGDNCPVSGRDVAASIIKYTFGTDIQEQKGR